MVPSVEPPVLRASSPSSEIADALRRAVELAVEGSRAEVIVGSPGHYSLVVTASAFVGKGTLEKQRLVYAAIGSLMRGEDAPVHAIDRLETRTVAPASSPSSAG